MRDSLFSLSENANSESYTLAWVLFGNDCRNSSRALKGFDRLVLQDRVELWRKGNKMSIWPLSLNILTDYIPIVVRHETLAVSFHPDGK